MRRRSTSTLLLLAFACADDLPILGEQCELNSECVEPYVCRYQRCRTECQTSRDCSLGSRCLASEQGAPVCRLDDEKSCASAGDCVASLACVAGACTSPCRDDDDCLAEDRCTTGLTPNEPSGCVAFSIVQPFDAGFAPDAVPATDSGPADTGATVDVGSVDAAPPDAGFTCRDPDPGCPAADLCNDPRNCGRCGTRCETGAFGTPLCEEGECKLDCDPGRADCNDDVRDGCETDQRRSNEHCGACNSACPASLPVCIDSDCVAPPQSVQTSTVVFRPTADVVLADGVHYFASVEIPAGVTVTTTGTGVLDIRATGDIVIAGTIDLSGGDGGDGEPNACGVQSGGGGATGRPEAGRGDRMLVCPPPAGGGTHVMGHA